MKKTFIKNLIKLISGSFKAKVIAATVSVAVLGGATTGGVLYYKSIHSNNNTEVVSTESSEPNKATSVVNKDTTKEESKGETTTTDSKTSDGKSTDTTNTDNSTNANGSGSVKKTSNSGGSDEQAPANQQPSTPPQQPSPPVQVGVDSSLTEQLRQLCVYGTSIYKGIKVGTFNSLLSQVSQGSLSVQSAQSQVNGMTWEEESNNIDKNYHGVAQIQISNPAFDKFNVGSGKTARQIVSEYGSRIKSGEFSNVIAYRNSDNTVTITNFACMFLVFK